MVRLYGVPGCGPCEIVKMFLAQKGVPFTFVNAREDQEAAKKVAELAGSPTAGVVLEWDGKTEVIRGVSPATLNAWYARYREKAS
ncbi:MULTISPECIES: glutaredoxin family protein [Thermus]|jgi:glutaredoxin-like protein NrdH|uniref:Glutaredoxin n=1 Tax=Thermus brockianus TaxID=56956 RepID=A0A1J0LSW1_THEBO|nr:glutaredoxin family protein [Thermus brockianus]APD09124.1 Glutaredoxin [Thermus brockianus]